MRGISIIVSAFAAVCASSTAGLAQTFQPWSPTAAMRTAGAELFREHCAICHAPPAGAPAFGPTLVGVVGRTAGTVPGFPYSEALKKSGIVWTEDNLRKWIGNNAQLVPGTRMAHVSLSDPAEQLYVVVYLRSLNNPSR